MSSTRARSDRSEATPAAPLAMAMSDLLRELAGRGERRSYRKGRILIEEGDRGDALYIILGGRLRAYSSGANGREITFGIYGPGEYVGEMSLDGGPRAASVETLDAAACAVVSRAVLQQFVDDRPAFAFELLTKVIRRARAATVSARNLALNDVYGRLKDLLESCLRESADPSQGLVARLTHQDMANRLGSSREMVSRLMKDLENGGYVERLAAGYRIGRPLPPRW
jgi:CRP/FNR family cyclic AMP-dependent transcriptional regulator